MTQIEARLDIFMRDNMDHSFSSLALALAIEKPPAFKEFKVLLQNWNGTGRTRRLQPITINKQKIIKYPPGFFG